MEVVFLRKIKLKILVYFAIIFAITVILILFASTLRNNVKNQFDDPKITDEMFVPESVITLSEQIGVLSDEISDKTIEITKLKERLANSEKEVQIYTDLGKIISYINNGDIDSAKLKLETIHPDKLNENTKNIYNLILKEIDKDAWH